MTVGKLLHLLAATTVLCGTVPPTSGFVLPVLAAQSPEEIDGLVRVKNKQLDHVYILPNANYSAYKRVRLDAVDVSFDKSWSRLNPTDIQKMRAGLANEFRKVLSDELGKGGYTLVDQDGNDVLRVTAMIVNLSITAPDKKGAGITRTYVASSGRVSLVAVVRDSVTGQHLARAVDTVQGRNTPRFELSSRARRLGDAQVAFSRWAKVLRTGLDDATGRAGIKSAAASERELR
jgi:hypothetical protein